MNAPTTDVDDVEAIRAQLSRAIDEARDRLNRLMSARDALDAKVAAQPRRSFAHPLHCGVVDAVRAVLATNEPMTRRDIHQMLPQFTFRQVRACISAMGARGEVTGEPIFDHPQAPRLYRLSEKGVSRVGG